MKVVCVASSLITVTLLAVFQIIFLYHYSHSCSFTKHIGISPELCLGQLVPPVNCSVSNKNEPNIQCTDHTSCQNLSSVISKEGYRAFWDGPFRVPGCKLHWYSGSDACDLISRAGRMIFVGDSLTRHLVQSIIMVINGDAERGGVVPGAPEFCRCGDQFEDGKFNKTCRSFSASYSSGRTLVCSSWESPRLVFLETSGKDETLRSNAIFLEDQLRQSAALNLRPIVFVMLGLHRAGEQKTGEQIIAVSYEPIYHALVNHSSLHPAAGRSVLLVGTNAPPGPNKLAMYLAWSGMNRMDEIAAAAQRFGEAKARLEGQARRPLVAVFDSFRILSRASSTDGTHFPMGHNLVLAQAWLNVLASSLSRA